MIHVHTNGDNVWASADAESVDMYGVLYSRARPSVTLPTGVTFATRKRRLQLRRGRMIVEATYSPDLRVRDTARKLRETLR